RHTSDLLLLAIRRPPTPPLFPYTTLFRSCECELAAPRNPTAFGSREHETALEPQRSARAARTVGRGNHFHSRDGRCVQRSRYARSEEHTSELQSRSDLVCRLLLEKKKQLL